MCTVAVKHTRDGCSEDVGKSIYYLEELQVEISIRTDRNANVEQIKSFFFRYENYMKGPIKGP